MSNTLARLDEIPYTDTSKVSRLAHSI